MRVHATTVTQTDCGWRSAQPFIVRYFIGLRRPRRRILGMEFAGEVEAVGAAVTEFAVGDERLRHRRVRRTRRVRLQAGERRDRAQADGHELRGGCGDLRRRVHRALVPAQGRPSTRAQLARLRRLGLGAELRRCSSRSTSARTSRPCATRRTSSSCARSARTGSSTTRRRTSRRTAMKPTTSSSTRSARRRSGDVAAR